MRLLPPPLPSKGISSVPLSTEPSVVCGSPVRNLVQSNTKLVFNKIPSGVMNVFSTPTSDLIVLFSDTWPSFVYS